VTSLIAESRGTSIRSVVQEFAESTLTDEESRERAERTRAYLAEHFGVEVTDEESVAMGRKLRETFTRPQLIQHHLVLDAPTLLALSGNRQVSALIHRAHSEPETRLWSPVLSILEADAEHLGLAEHVDQLGVILTVDLDYAAMLAVARLCGDGVPPGSRLPSMLYDLCLSGAGALVAMVDTKAYEGRGVALLNLNRSQRYARSTLLREQTFPTGQPSGWHSRQRAAGVTPGGWCAAG
jgi:hypothetical protein